VSNSARGRPRDPQVSEAIIDATRRLLAEQGFARMSLDAVAGAAGVGKPAIYRRFRDKADLVVATIRTALPEMHRPQQGETRAELRAVLDEGLPDEPESYVALIGGLIAEHRRHPELIEAFREHLLLPRRAIVIEAIARGQDRGDIRRDLAAETALDMFAGQLLARVFAGRAVDRAWRDAAFEAWWRLISARDD
jgi:AcrR family transcriptional regulator